MTEADKKRIADILEKHDVVVGYLFGSALSGTMGPHSDIDIGVVFESELSSQEDFDRRFKLSEEISRAFKVPETDIINLKTVTSPLIKYQSVFSGEPILIKNHDVRFAVERAIVREYEDTRSLRSIMSGVLREELQNGTFGTFSKQ